MASKSKAKGDLIDNVALREAMLAAAEKHQGRETMLRKALLKLASEAWTEARGAAEKRLHAERRAGLDIARALSKTMDGIISGLFDVITGHMYPVPNPTNAERIAVIATGGYGRGALAPQSDIDLLFLFPHKQTGWHEQVIETLLYLLWDLKLKVGQAVRGIDDCIRLARDDFTIRTAVLEARHLDGDEDLTEALKQRLWKELFAKSGREFVDAKLAERDARHRAHGESRYLVEPNIKDGKGGLRDLQTMFWIAKYLFHTEDPDDMIEAGVFSRTEYRNFIKARRYLWTVRCHLHFLSGRAEERLSFDVQQEMAERLGYQDHAGIRGVERFMKHYFLTAKDVGDLTRIFCAVLEKQEKKAAPSFNRFIPTIFRGRKKVVEGFPIVANRLSAASEDVFDADPVNLIRLFHAADRTGLDIHPDALKLVTRSLKLINKDLRADPEANRLFLGILTSKNDPESGLYKMNEAGVLGRFVLDFGRIVALMQFNMYHHYTADEHLIRAIGILSRIEKQELVEDHPLSSKIIQSVLSRKVLYVALFLHDIAKGRPEDHSVAGGKIARRLCPRLGMSAAETEAVEWLVLNHLVMSDVAQKRDIADPKTVRDFADLVQSPERLRLLLCLTVADIRAVGPGVWNGWKGELLRQLYYETESLLQGGVSGETRKHRVEAAKEALREHLSGWTKKDIKAFLDRHYDPYWLALDTDSHAAHAELMRDAGTGEAALAIRAEPDAWRAITRVSLTMPDHPGVFARICGALAIAGMSVTDAKIFTTNDGMAINTFWVQDIGGVAVREPKRLKRIEEIIRNSLAGKVVVPDALKQKRGPLARERAFTVAPQVLIDNNASATHSVIEVNGRDRPGLLYDLARALGRQNLVLSSAQIATFGERAVDVFYVKDAMGQKITTDPKKRSVEKAMLAATERSKVEKKAA